jgi:hypothetical protein
MVRYYELFENQTEIEELLKEYFEITGKPTINPDGTVDVEGHCELKPVKKVNQLPVKFGKVSGHFNCYDNQLTSLIGAPHSVGGHFYCDDNRLTSLEGGPQSVGGDFYCYRNQLTSLVGAPQSVGGDFDCYNNQLTSLEGAPQSVGGNFYCGDNQLTSLVGAPQSVGGRFYCDWSPTLPLLRIVVAKEVVILKDDGEFEEINDILNSSIKDNPGSYRKAALDAKRKLMDAGYEGNAKW